MIVRTALSGLALGVALSACQSRPTTATADTTAQAAPSDAPATSAISATRSPWDDARARKVAFRGIGTEPVWLVEVGHGEAPRMHIELDYGARETDVAQAQPLSGLLGYVGKSGDGSDVRLLIEREPCSDGMSDTAYPASARLTVGTQTYRGCGRFLSE